MLACTSYRLDLLCVQIDATNGVIFGIRDIQQVANQRNALRAIKLRPGKVSVCIALFASPDNLANLACQVCHYKPVMRRVTDDETIGLCVNSELAGEGKEGFGRCLAGKTHGVMVKQTLGVKFCNHFLQQFFSCIWMNLAFMFANNSILRVDEDKRRPGTDSVFLP